MQIKKGIQAQILKLVIKSQENKRGREEERPYKNKFKRIKKMAIRIYISIKNAQTTIQFHSFHMLAR